MMDHNDTPSGSSVIARDRIISLDTRDTIKAFIDFAGSGDDGSMAIIGWVFDPADLLAGFSLLRENRDESSLTYTAVPVEQGRDFQVVRFPRPDVAHVMSVAETRDNNFGFSLVFSAFPSDGKLALAFSDETFSILPFVGVTDLQAIKGELRKLWPHSGGPLLSLLETELGDLHPLTQAALALRPQTDLGGADQMPAGGFHVECVVKLKEGLILVGWLAAAENEAVGIQASGKNGWKWQASFRDGDNGQILMRTFRPDLQSQLADVQSDRGQAGFVFFWPLVADVPAKISVRFDNAPGAQTKIPVIEAARSFTALSAAWIHAGDALRKIAARLPDSMAFANLLDDIEEMKLAEGQVGFITCDQALLLNSCVLILNGWIARPAGDIERIELVTDCGHIDVTSRVRHYMRPDLFGLYPWSEEEPLGFLCLIEDPSGLTCNVRLKIVFRDGRCQVVYKEAEVMDWPTLGKFINLHPPLAKTLLTMLANSAALEDDPRRLQARLAALRQNVMLARLPHLSTSVDQPDTVVAAVERAYPLGEAGLLVFGWQYLPKHRPVAVTVCSPGGAAVEVASLMSPLVRVDVMNHLKQRFPTVAEWCGFVSLVPLPTKPGEMRLLCYDFGEKGEVWLKIPTDKPIFGGIELIKEVLASIPAPDKMRHILYDFFGRGVGPALEAINLARPPFAGRVEERQFGPVAAAGVSVIVPLYGRCDFLRHQLAQFADDPDFRAVDLIYVVDDPAIVGTTLELAARYQSLFDRSFRVVWYGENRGFAGANNIGASVARGDYLLLMNSDVLPQQPGWLTALVAALLALPDAGAVGPLLQFGDGAIQHAGMHPRRDPLLPGFLLNTHPGMGMAWSGPDEPSEQPMLTAACVLLRKADYFTLGGLDEGYVVGDFEDADLCMALRKQGKRLWLEPKAKLWHLERQSQNSGELGPRQLLTLYNAWRYGEKIRRGAIADPTLEN